MRTCKQPRHTRWALAILGLLAAALAVGCIPQVRIEEAPPTGSRLASRPLESMAVPTTTTSAATRRPTASRASSTPAVVSTATSKSAPPTPSSASTTATTTPTSTGAGPAIVVESDEIVTLPSRLLRELRTALDDLLAGVEGWESAGDAPPADN